MAGLTTSEVWAVPFSILKSFQGGHRQPSVDDVDNVLRIDYGTSIKHFALVLSPYYDDDYAVLPPVRLPYFALYKIT